MVEFIFWASLLLIAYTLVGYPALAYLRGALWKREVQRAEITPRVSLMMVAHNEAAVMHRKLENLLSLDYPR